ncbi:trascriptional regulator [Bacillus coahuilensis p1.1.43]|uniref:Polyisoprenyl-teichoic acid--peptidoglycan teichoic acid transferase TagU n=1 Tax=Bacillus coahuilensis p1.1.43 TaxID=1150625 RepID=A0A147KCF9_9BACI|nr:trascriptional regulator [Bacillus coahuilensis p1.1.43]
MLEKKRKGRGLKIFLSIIGLILLGVFVYLFVIYQSFSSSIEKMHTPTERVSERRTEELNFQKQEPFSVLLLGVDEREGDSGRSDTMIVLTVNPEQQSTKMLSIPRDTYTEIIGKGYKDKINHAYAFGGVEMSMDTIENMLDIPIDYFVQVNMDGFKDIVDAVGGVTVYNDLSFNYDGYSFPEGELELTGAEALSFSRMRYEDPRGDFGRQIRQREVINAVLQEGASVQSLWKFQGIFDALGNNVKTNLTFEEMVDIQGKYHDAAKKLENFTIENGYGETIDGKWMYIVPEEEMTKVQTTLKSHLGITE